MTRARLAFAALFALALGCPREGPKTLGGHERPLALGATFTDPVTGARCERDPQTESLVFESRNFYFCQPENRPTFLKSPARYAYR